MAGSYASFAQCEINDVRYDFHPASMIGVKEEHLDTNGLRGTRSRSIERNMPNLKRVNGQLKLIPTATEMTTLLPWINGAAAVSTSYPLGETLTAYTIVIDRIIKVHTYAGCKVGRARFHCAQGSALNLDLDVIGTTETEGAAASFSSTSIDIATRPWMFHQMTLTVDGTSVTPKSYEETLDNVIDSERFFNSQTLTVANATDRHHMLRIELPYGDSAATYTDDLLATGVPVVATWTNGVYILTRTFAKVAFTKVAPEINDRGEIFLVLSGEAFKSSTTEAVTCSLAVS